MIPRMSKKKLASLDGKLPFSTISSAPKKRIRKKPRSKSERERIYGPPGYVEWIHEQTCVACRQTGYSECAHIGTGGTGRKDDWVRTVPLCRRFAQGFSWGCHPELHAWGRRAFGDNYGINLSECAKATQELWLAHTNGDPEK